MVCLLPGIFGEAANIYGGIDNTIAGVKANLRPGFFREAANIYGGINNTIAGVNADLRPGLFTEAADTSKGMNWSISRAYGVPPAGRDELCVDKQSACLLPGIQEAANIYGGINNTIAGVKADLRPGLVGGAADVYNGINGTISRAYGVLPASRAELRADNQRLEAELQSETFQRQAENNRSQTLLNALVAKVNSLTPVSPTSPSFSSLHTPME